MRARVVTDQPTSGQVVLHVHGRLDQASAGAVRRALGDLIDAGHRTVIVDLAGLTGADAAGLAVLLAAARRCRVRGQLLVLARSQPEVARVLALTRGRDLVALPASA